VGLGGLEPQTSSQKPFQLLFQVHYKIKYQSIKTIYMLQIYFDTVAQISASLLKKHSPIIFQIIKNPAKIIYFAGFFMIFLAQIRQAAMVSTILSSVIFTFYCVYLDF
jgi:hypothetical protein